MAHDNFVGWGKTFPEGIPLFSQLKQPLWFFRPFSGSAGADARRARAKLAGLSSFSLLQAARRGRTPDEADARKAIFVLIQ